MPRLREAGKVVLGMVWRGQEGSGMFRQEWRVADWQGLERRVTAGGDSNGVL